MSAWRKWFYRNGCLWSLRLWAVIALITISAGLSGYLFAWASASASMAERRADALAEVQRLQDINRQLLLIIEQRLPAITAKTDVAAEKAGAAADVAARAAATAQAAAKSAHAAGTTAKAASTKAGRAATAARDAATTLNEALEPQQPAPPASAPAWLDTP